MPDPIYFGKSLIRLKTVDSTNNYSTELLKAGFVAEGTVIMAEQQTAGRGQRGSTWQSEPGRNLTFSLILIPKFLQANDHFFLTMAMSLGVADALKEILGNADVAIKWPNDILVSEKKICGILIETLSTGGNISSAIVGIGLNVLQEDFGNIEATSLKQQGHFSASVNEVLDLVLFFLEKRYLQLKNGKLNELKSDYLQKIYRMNIESDFEDKQGVFTGRITGVKDSGLLQIITDQGNREFSLKEVKMIF